MSNQVKLFENQINHQDIKIVNKSSQNYPKTVRLRGLILNNLVQSLQIINHKQSSLNHVDFI